MNGQFSPGGSRVAQGALRRRLRFGPSLVSISALLWAGHALAQTTVTTDTTAPLVTSSAGDITVNSGASIKPASGVAVTVDSNNKVSNSGTISFHNVDNATGVLVKGGITTAIDNLSSIVVDEDQASTTDSNGIVHGPFAKGINRYGLRLAGPGGVTGSVINESTGVISVTGNNSTALSIETSLFGTLTSAGAITATGDNSFGLHAISPITGDVKLSGTISVSGQNTQGVALSDVGGAVNILSTITSTGYRYTTRSTSADFLKLLAPDDLLQGGSAVTIAGNVAGGVVLDSVSTTDASGTTTVTSASINTFGSAPAMVVGGAGRSITIGNVGTGDNAFGVEIKGSVTGTGVYDGVTATGLQLGAANGAVDTSGGVKVTGAIAGSSYAAAATGVHVLSGVSAPIFKNDGNIGAVMNSDAAAAATAIAIDQGANLHTLQNSASISAQVAGQTGDAIAVQDKSGTVSEVENIRTISASRTLSTTAAVTGHAIALDLSANTGGVHIIQTDPSAGTTPPSITGEIRTGSGGDNLELLAGTVSGDISLGAGANALTVDGGAVVKGGLTAQGGTVALKVGNGTLQVNSAQPLSLTSLTLGSTSTTILTADPVSGTASSLNVAGAATIASGAKLGVQLASLLDSSQTYTLIHAQSLTSGAIDTSLLGAVPFLYKSSLATDLSAGTVTATLTRKTAAELALPATTAGGYDAVVRAANRDSGLRGALLAQTDRSGLISLYNQLLPNHSGSIYDTAAATVQAFAQPLDDRKDPHGGGFWLQETNLGLFSDGSSDDPGYKAWSFGLVGGYELPATALGILGVTVGFSTETVYPDHVTAGADLHSSMMDAGIYWRASRGGFSADAELTGQYLSISSTRVISILGGDGLAVNRIASGDWHAFGVDGRVMLAYEAVRGRYYLRPTVVVDYFRLMEDGYSESGGGDGMNLTVDSRTSSRLTAFAGLTAGAVYGATRDWGPEVTLGYKGVVSSDLGNTTARFTSGGNSFTLIANDVNGQGAMAHIALRGENGSGAFSVEGGAEARDSLTIYDLKLAGHIQF